jgi:hypothetical protein
MLKVITESVDATLIRVSVALKKVPRGLSRCIDTASISHSEFNGSSLKQLDNARHIAAAEKIGNLLIMRCI